jgi:hypothetical protein
VPEIMRGASGDCKPPSGDWRSRLGRRVNGWALKSRLRLPLAGKPARVAAETVPIVRGLHDP